MTMSAQTLIVNLSHYLGQSGKGWSPATIEMRDSLAEGPHRPAEGLRCR